MRQILPIAALVLAVCGCTVAQAEPFSGPHVDGIVGWSHEGNVQHELCSGAVCKSAKDKDGFFYGGGAGYDFRTGDLVIGGAAEFSDTTGKSCRTYDHAT